MPVLDGRYGACHDGKKAFKAQAGCMKCHKKEAK